MPLLFDADAFIKLQRADILEHVARTFDCIIPEAVYHEVVTRGRLFNHSDAEAIDRIIQSGMVVQPPMGVATPDIAESIGVDAGEKDVLGLPQAPLGAQTLRVTVGSVSALTSVTVTEPLITPPTPTPTPPPPMASLSALQPLLDTNSLVRVWNFNNSTKIWTFFDTRPAFADVNTIFEMISGQVYWFNLLADETVTLNGKPRSVTSGWNLLSW